MLPVLRKDPPGPGFLLSLHQLGLLRGLLADAPPRAPEDVRYADPVARTDFAEKLKAVDERNRRMLDPDRDRLRLHLTDLEAEGLLGLLAERPAHGGLRRMLLGQARSEGAIEHPELLEWADRLTSGASLGFAAFRAGKAVPNEPLEVNRTVWIETDVVLDL